MNTIASFKLFKKLAIVTGGSGLYGKPICTALAEAGAHVIIASRNKDNCIALADELGQKGYLATGMELDLSDNESVIRLVKNVLDQFGRIDILVNNAVSRDGFKNLDEISLEEWESAQKINSTGMMLISQAVIDWMKKQKSGNIINIGSIQGTVGPNFPVYGNTDMTSPINYTYDKWGMVGFTKWIANYYGKYNIRCNCISPGGYGPGVEAMKGKEEFIENYKRLTPMQRFANENDIKGPIVFLASEASCYVTGHNLVVDGGWTAW